VVYFFERGGYRTVLKTRRKNASQFELAVLHADGSRTVHVTATPIAFLTQFDEVTSVLREERWHPWPADLL
jgi:hypothetical protein